MHGCPIVNDEDFLGRNGEYGCTAFELSVLELRREWWTAICAEATGMQLRGSPSSPINYSLIPLYWISVYLGSPTLQTHDLHRIQDCRPSRLNQLTWLVVGHC